MPKVQSENNKEDIKGVLMNKERVPTSKIRRQYIFRFFVRVAIFIFCVAAYVFAPRFFDVLQGSAFFEEFSPFHILWLIWMFDMVCQLIPVKEHIPLGSQKHFVDRFRPIKEKINYQALRNYVVTTTKSAYKVFIIWIALIIVIGVFHRIGLLSDRVIFMISVLFYVCDLICVLFWCPFRLIMKNKCCTTCRIFNWDHLMMFTPMIYIDGFFSCSLLLTSIAVWVVWELCFMMYPERFWEHSNTALKCSECTDKLCTQYCRKLR